MGNIITNIAKGRTNELFRRVNDNDPAGSAIILVLLKLAQADADLEDYATLSLLLANAGNTECDFTNYSRITLADADLDPPTVDNTGNTQGVDIPDQTWVSAGGAINNDVVKLLVCYDSDVGSGTDANIIPMHCFDFVFTTSGSDLQAVVNADGLYQAG